jgi:hypothetical protein
MRSLREINRDQDSSTEGNGLQRDRVISFGVVLGAAGKISDRCDDEISLDEVEKIVI